MNACAYIVSIEFSHEGERILGAFGSLDYAKSRAVADGSGDDQHIRLFDGAKVELHVSRGVKYRRVPHPTDPRCYTSEADGWTEWTEVRT